MHGGTRIGLLLGGLVLVTGYAFVRDGRSLPERPPSGAVAEAAEPAAGNVGHAVRAEIEALRRRVTAAPADTASLVRLGRLLQDAHRPAEAATYYRRYLDHHPANRQAWLDLANCYAAAGQWTDARGASLALLERAPGDPTARYNLGAVYANQRDWAAARAAWEQVSAQDRDTALAARAAAALRRLPPSP